MNVFWLGIGLAGQSCLAARFLIQWIASERRGDSVVPPAFWALSLAGGTAVLAYAIHRRDPIFIVGQSAGLIVYARNLTLIRRRARGRENTQCPAHTI
jgi:lipid-A-disaccharide synthase-like uncharacterized protein